ncbi:DUF452 family protein [Halosquirtibacter laminarini]|uniref:DUF452 family protein n=1 Tax=Halosquirtibacter laminarini TaxID=3374600 RepID=A0AC61NDS8_9BACT|nr:DUF452 family protein [Prolixibacteraceae bacterium]
MKQIIFFNGWGMDINNIVHIHKDKNTIITEINRYHQYTTPKIVEEASEVILIAWSLGAQKATSFYLENGKHITKYIIFNGSCDGFNKESGLPITMAKLTANRWNPEVRKRFETKMNGIQKDSSLSQRSCKDQKNELLYLIQNEDNIQSSRLEENDPKIKIYISRNEKIYPIDNLLNCWKKQQLFFIDDMFHNVFIDTKSWDQWI